MFHTHLDTIKDLQIQSWLWSEAKATSVLLKHLRWLWWIRYKNPDQWNSLKFVDVSFYTKEYWCGVIEIKCSKLKSIPTYERWISKLEPHQLSILDNLHTICPTYIAIYHNITGIFYFYIYNA